MTTKTKNALICVSGGVESTTLAYKLRFEKKYSEILALYINYGHRATKEEKYCIEKISQCLSINFIEIKLPYLNKISKSYLTNKKISHPEISDNELNNIELAKQRMKLWWIPSRNAIISVLALSIAESKLLYYNEFFDIYLGLRRETPLPMPDNTKEFVDAVNNLYKNAILRYHTKGFIKMYAPFLSLSKEDIIKLGEKLKVPWQLTYSCYSGNSGKLKNNIPVHCGGCSNCKRRKQAFYNTKIKDLSIYSKN